MVVLFISYPVDDAACCLGDGGEGLSEGGVCLVLSFSYYYLLLFGYGVGLGWG